jgi:hypothetical protein
MSIGDVLTVAASVVISLVAVWLASFLARRTSKADIQSQAYENFITSAEILVLRAMVFRQENLFRPAVLAPLSNSMGPLLASLAIGLTFKGSIPISELMKMAGDTVRGGLEAQPRSQQAVSYDSQLESFEDMQRRWLKVRLVGSEQVVAAGLTLMKASRDLIQEVLPGSPTLPWRERGKAKA